jgi:hypothetical protein
MNILARGSIHRDWVRPPGQTLGAAPNACFFQRLEVPALGKRAFIDPRPYSRAAALAMTWALPPEPQDAEDASQQMNDYFDAVAARFAATRERHPAE